jgi:MFS family permease
MSQFIARDAASATQPLEAATLIREQGLAREQGLTREQKRNLALASLGSLLEFYEFMVFGFFTAVIGKLFFPPDLPEAVKTFQAFSLYSLGFLLRPLSGAIIGHLGDKFGRKRLFMLTVLLMALPTTLIGLLPTYAEIGIAAPIILLILRILQGIAVAGEFAGASVFVTEHIPGSRVGTASGFVLGANYIGFFLGAGTGALAANFLSPGALEAWGWRIPFLIGGVFGLLAVYLRRQLDETPLFLDIRRMKDRAKAFPFGEVLKTYLVPSIYDVLLGVYLGTMIIILYFYMPTLLQTQYGFDRATSFNANTAALLLLAVMCPLWGRLGDKIGVGRVLAIGAAGLTLDLFLFFRNLELIAQDPGQLLWWSLSFSVFMSSAAVIPALGALVFPTEVRFTGFGFGYNVGSLIAAAAPTIISWIVLSYGKSTVAYYGMAVGVLGIALALWAQRLTYYPRPG